jgi:GT2 family glycosyltransferase
MPGGVADGDDIIQTVVAVVVTYNRKVLLAECLTALLSQSYQIEKIVLVNNACTDGTLNYLQEQGFLINDKIDCQSMVNNIGGAGGFHFGMKAAMKYNPDWIWIMDDDTIPYENSLEALLIAKTKIKEKVSFLASRVVDTEGEFMNTPGISRKVSSNGLQDGCTI